MVNLQTTRWSPDTCDCVIEYEWDRDEPTATRVHTGKNIVKDCPDHSGLGTPVNFYNAVLGENQRKNRVRQDFLENFTALRDTDGNGNFVFKNGINISYNFTGIDNDRVLHISVTGITLTTPQKNTIQSIADGKFGAGKVVID